MKAKKIMTLRIGTRQSPLALKQTDLFIQALTSIPIHDYKIIPINTTGDIIRDRPLYDIGGKALFAKEIETALLQNEIDCAVHSLKDLETIMAPNLTIAAVLKREDPRDCLISKNNCSLPDLPQGAHIGTCSPRREAQLRNLRPDLKISPIRGNIQTRIEQVLSGKYDATLLAVAGLSRMNLLKESNQFFSIKEILPAAGQGAIAIQIRQNDEELTHLLSPLNHLPTVEAVTAEREVLRVIQGNCRTPIAAHAFQTESDFLYLKARLWKNGKLIEAEGSGHAPLNLGQYIGKQLKETK